MEIIKKYKVTLILRIITATAKVLDDFRDTGCDFVVKSVKI